jgi:hypothetical protein
LYQVQFGHHVSGTIPNSPVPGTKQRFCAGHHFY